MPFPAATLLLILFTAVYLCLVFYVLPLYLIVLVSRRRERFPEKPYLGARAAAKLLPVLITSFLILTFAGSGPGGSWFEAYLRQANDGNEWAILILLGEVVALSAYLGGKLTKAEKILMKT